MKELDKNEIGLIVGVFFGLIHLTWAVLVAAGFAKTVLDWIYGLHFLSNPFKVQEFNVTNAFFLVVVTFAAGYVLGWIFTAVWNWLAEKK